ncbi:MAG: hypothetical protein A2V78_17995 [Betaproteobacteria bacterium RBG_16_64_18]|nr:MAG: hypothetical protein A2V78_17995 [Betaproteobacteria bacterium RBG_16_64_18]
MHHSLFVTVTLATVSGLCAAQTAPSLTAGGQGFVLTVPYLEYGSGASKVAFSASLVSSDLHTFVLDGASVQSVRASEIDNPTVAALNSGYRFALPRISFASGGTTRYYSATLTTIDLSSFTLDIESVGEIPAPGSLAAPAGVTVTNSGQQTVGGSAISSSSKLLAAWSAPRDYAVDHYEITAAESIYGASTVAAATASGTSKILTGLKAATPYTVTVKACSDSACSQSGVSSAASGTTSEEYWQLQGSGNTVSELTKIVSDGNARISATRFGPEAGTVNASRIQLYYGPSPARGSTTAQLATAVTSQATDAGVSASYLNFTSMAGTTGLISPSTATTLVKQVATGQGVPLSAAMGGGKVRLFFEAAGSDNKTRILYLDSQDGYTGRDFKSGTSSTTCSTTADYQPGGGCAPTVVIGVEGDSTNANSKISNARQFKLGFPVLDDWRWDGAAGTFMVFTTDKVTGCSDFNMNHGYAVWDGTNWNVQYEANGCPKLFKSAQAAFPMHLGEARYKIYFGDPSITTGKGSSTLPFLGPKKLIYAGGRGTGSRTNVDFEDWESTSSGRNVVFVWPNGEQLSASAEGYIDDFHFLAPTGSLDLQVMYLAITDGIQPPIGAAAVLLNP